MPVRVALKHVPFVHVVRFKQHIACFRLQLQKRSTGLAAQDAITLAPNHVGIAGISIRSGQLVDLAWGKRYRRRIDADTVGMHDPKQPLAVDALPGFRHEQMTLAFVDAARALWHIVLMKDLCSVANDLYLV
ncbi:hypothetical protein, partial [Dyella sp.]|uniref:hypothetical protein n=1 Tax=Dyella sp. TaxID=1869338 RepID=UPI002B4A92BE